jgi:hypothetical protein
MIIFYESYKPECLKSDEHPDEDFEMVHPRRSDQEVQWLKPQSFGHCAWTAVALARSDGDRARSELSIMAFWLAFEGFCQAVKPNFSSLYLSSTFYTL